MAYSQIAVPDKLRSVAFGSISETYTALGTAFAYAMRISKVNNATDGDMFIAVTNGATPASDGSDDNFFMPANSFDLFDVTTNAVIQQPSVFVWPIGTRFWVRQSTAPTEKGVYLSTIYGRSET